MGYCKWIFFDIGSTLVDESECCEARYKESTAGTDVSFIDSINIYSAPLDVDRNGIVNIRDYSYIIKKTA